MGYQLKAKTLTQQGSQPEKDLADPEAHFIPPYVGSPFGRYALCRNQCEVGSI